MDVLSPSSSAIREKDKNLQKVDKRQECKAVTDSKIAAA
jgi:hypothetical protein